MPAKRGEAAGTGAGDSSQVSPSARSTEPVTRDDISEIIT